MNKAPTFNSSTWILLSIVLVGALIRLFLFWDIPFTHDELSAINRVHFETFEELITKGVLIEGHPAGVQVFLYYFTSLFGTEEWVVKLPFILLGIATIPLTYAVGRVVSHPTAAALSASVVAVTEYFVFHSQVARMYIPGVFFILLAVYFWSRILYKKEYSWKYFTGWVLASVATMYVHHLALFAVVLVGISGLILAEHKRKMFHVLGGLAMIAGYAPHIPILFKQMELGGIGEWLEKPTPSFLADFTQYLFHYSWVFIGLILLILVVLRFVGESKEHKFFWLGLVWFLVTFITAYIYSVEVNPLLRFSTLLFTTPFALISLFSILPEKSDSWNGFAVFGILLVGVLTLYGNRQYFRVMYTSAYEQLVLDGASMREKYGKDVAIFYDIHPDIFDYYVEKHGVDTTGWMNVSESSVRYYEQALDVDNVALLFLYNHVVSDEDWIYHRFPNAMEHKSYYQGDFYLFSKDSNSTVPFYLEEPAQEATVINRSFDEREYVGQLSLSANWENHIYGVVTYTVEVDSVLGEYSLCSYYQLGDEKWGWKAVDVGWNHLNASDAIADCFGRRVLPNEAKPGAELHFYLWNRRKASLYVKDARIRVREGNAILYGLYRDIP